MKVLALESKHSTEYWDASNETAAFLAAFRFNDEFGCYGDLDNREVDDAARERDELAMLKTDLDAGKVAKPLLREAVQQVAELAKAIRWVENLKRQLDLYKTAKKGDGAAAKLLFQYRDDYEYEKWEIIDVKEPRVAKKKR